MCAFDRTPGHKSQQMASGSSTPFPRESDLIHGLTCFTYWNTYKSEWQTFSHPDLVERVVSFYFALHFALHFEINILCSSTLRSFLRYTYSQIRRLRSTGARRSNSLSLVSFSSARTMYDKMYT